MKFNRKSNIKKSVKNAIHRKRRVPQEFLEEYEVYEYKSNSLKKSETFISYSSATVSISTPEVFAHQIFK